MRKEIIEELASIIDKPLVKIGRAHDLTWLNFGEELERVDRKGVKRVYGEFSLNIQCDWRMARGSEIIIASKDIYSSKSKHDEKAEFNWEVFGSNKFDERASVFNHFFQNPLIVKEIEADELGSLKISFGDGTVLEVFPDESSDGNEFWRFINRNNQQHMVISGAGVEL